MQYWYESDVKENLLVLEYNPYCVWLHDENDEIIDNDNQPDRNDNQQLTDVFMAVGDLYDTFFIDNKHEFRCVGCPNDETRK